METLLYTQGILNFKGINYELLDVNYQPEMSVLAILNNEQYSFTIALVANETIINEVLQTSSEMIVDTLTS